jgi:hypothetical protein
MRREEDRLRRCPLERHETRGKFYRLILLGNKKGGKLGGRR